MMAACELDGSKYGDTIDDDDGDGVSPRLRP